MTLADAQISQMSLFKSRKLRVLLCIVGIYRELISLNGFVVLLTLERGVNTPNQATRAV